MINKLDITASIVLYNEDLNELTKTVNCFLKGPLKKKLFLIDNTPTKKFKNSFINDNIEYIGVGKNIGFGAGHNLIIDKVANLSKNHLILNPDVNFNKNLISNLIIKLNESKEIAMIAPKVLFPEGRYQSSCRRYPSVSELLARRFSCLKPFFKKNIAIGKYKDKDLTIPFFADYLTGCFQLYKTRDFVDLGGFDERYFLYMEDVDICRKIDDSGKKKLYYPKEEIIHVLKQGSSKDLKLFFRHTNSAIKYFLKWGLTNKT